MTSFGSIPEAAYIAIYGMILVARNKELINTQNVATKLSASRHHVTKIFQVLQQNNYLGSIRGPKGGFYLIKDSSEINLLEIFELVAGKIQISECSLNRENCPFPLCIFDLQINSMKSQFADFLRTKTIADCTAEEIKE